MEEQEIMNPLPEADEPAPENKSGGIEKAKTFAHEWVGSFVSALLIVIVLFTFAFRMVRVDGESMFPTLKDHDFLVLTGMGGRVKTGDIVVLQVPTYKNGTPLIKRVIATGGQRVKIDFENWTVTVDGVELDETYINRTNSTMNRIDCPEEFVVSEGCIFVMGDNRNNSTDSRSRSVGQVDERYVMGKVIFRMFSLSPLGTEKNPLLSPYGQDGDK